jgi:hypothetical protein
MLLLVEKMANGIQHIQATQFFKLPSSNTRGVPEARNKVVRKKILYSVSIPKLLNFRKGVFMIENIA